MRASHFLSHFESVSVAIGPVWGARRPACSFLAEVHVVAADHEKTHRWGAHQTEQWGGRRSAVLMRARCKAAGLELPSARGLKAQRHRAETDCAFVCPADDHAHSVITSFPGACLRPTTSGLKAGTLCLALCFFARDRWTRRCWTFHQSALSTRCAYRARLLRHPERAAHTLFVTSLLHVKTSSWRKTTDPRQCDRA